MAMPRPATVDDYLANLAPGVRRAARTMRSTIRKAAPKAEESISYGIPFYRHNGKRMVYFAFFKEHYSLFALSADVRRRFAKRLEGYVQAKGTIRFPLEKPVPVALVTALVKAQAKENETARRPV